MAARILLVRQPLYLAGLLAQPPCPFQVDSELVGEHEGFNGEADRTDHRCSEILFCQFYGRLDFRIDIVPPSYGGNTGSIPVGTPINLGAYQMSPE